VAGDFSAQRHANVVTVTGEIDMATAPELREAIAAADLRQGRLVVDLSAVTFLDSAGVAVLFDHAAHGLELIITPGSLITVVLEVTGLTQAVTVRYATGEIVDG
jgi:anti-sigma B factor antagonist